MPAASRGVAMQRHPVELDARVAAAPARDLVRDARFAHARPEPVGRRDEPVHQEPAVRQADHPEPLRVSEPERDGVVERGMHVRGIDAAPVVELRPDPVARRSDVEPRMFGRTTR